MANFGETLVSFITDQDNILETMSHSRSSTSLEPPNKRLKIERSLTPEKAQTIIDLVSGSAYVVDKSLLIDDFINSKRNVGPALAANWAQLP
jgi:hypothetical protein